MKLEAGSLKEVFGKLQRNLLKYAGLMCFIFVAAVYSFMVWRIGVLSNIQPDQNAVNAQLKTAQVPNIDKDALKKIQDLQDNSVSVQSLFNQARDNPFHE
jgi:hypothetical protein